MFLKSLTVILRRFYYWYNEIGTISQFNLKPKMSFKITIQNESLGFPNWAYIMGLHPNIFLSLYAKINSDFQNRLKSASIHWEKFLSLKFFCSSSGKYSTVDQPSYIILLMDRMYFAVTSSSDKTSKANIRLILIKI